MRFILSCIWWPLLFGTAMWLIALGMEGNQTFLVFNAVFLSFAAIVGVLERVLPHERAWHNPDGQIVQDIAHTILTKGTVQVMIVFSAVIGIADLTQAEAAAWWPVHWPMVAQAFLGLLIAEFGLYWAHRLSHEVPLLWRFHALHHSVRRLWFVNTGRFHIMDTVLSLVASMPLLVLAGAPADVIVWVGIVTPFVGMLTHCNIELRCGPLNYIFNTPILHRWHHSTDLREGNKNYGEILITWDLVFGTYINPNRRPPLNIGINDAMPRGFFGQLLAPFRWTRLQAEAKSGEAEDLMTTPREDPMDTTGDGSGRPPASGTQALRV